MAILTRLSFRDLSVHTDRRISEISAFIRTDGPEISAFIRTDRQTSQRSSGRTDRRTDGHTDRRTWIDPAFIRTDRQTDKWSWSRIYILTRLVILIKNIYTYMVGNASFCLLHTLSETIPSASYILTDEYSIPFFSTSNGYKQKILLGQLSGSLWK